jgi:N6-L-threonylcarbamoyladenine synthase
MLREPNYDFSFSGLKTSVLYFFKEHTSAKKADIAASFQQAAVDVLTAKTTRAAAAIGARGIILCGGVAANQELRTSLRRSARNMKIPFFVPEKAYNFDNAAMIGAAGYMAYLRKKKYRLSAQGTLNI